MMLCILHDPQFQDIIPFLKLIWDHFGVDLSIISRLGIISGSGPFRGVYCTFETVYTLSCMRYSKKNVAFVVLFQCLFGRKCPLAITTDNHNLQFRKIVQRSFCALANVYNSGASTSPRVSCRQKLISFKLLFNFYPFGLRLFHDIVWF